jgi:excisionase family DNA binding protein
VAQTEALLSPEDLSEYLGIPVKSIYQWRYRNVGPPAIRVGRHLRWRSEDVQTWLRSQSDVKAS